MSSDLYKNLKTKEKSHERISVDSSFRFPRKTSMQMADTKFKSMGLSNRSTIGNLISGASTKPVTPALKSPRRQRAITLNASAAFQSELAVDSKKLEKTSRKNLTSFANPLSGLGTPAAETHRRSQATIMTKDQTKKLLPSEKKKATP